MFFREKLKDISDEILIARYQTSGKGKWVGELYNRYAHLVLGVCLGYFKNKMHAEDAQQAIFEKLLKDLKTKEIQNFSGWLYVVSKNYCLMELRGHKSAKYRVEYEDHEFPQEEETFTTEETLVALEEAIDALKPEQEYCVKKFYLEQKSYKEIVAMSSYTLKEVKSHIQNGRRNLSLAMKRKAEQ